MDDRRRERPVVGDDLVVCLVGIDPLDRVAEFDRDGLGRERRPGDLHCARRRKRACRKREREGCDGDEEQSAHLNPPRFERNQVLLPDKTDKCPEKTRGLLNPNMLLRQSERPFHA